MTRQELDAIRQALEGYEHDQRIRTHWEGCSASHPWCAVAVLLREIDRLQRTAGTP
jgi:hypothetical protein